MAHNLPAAANPEKVSFADDDRAFFNKETGTWRLEDDDGAEFEYDEAKSTWVPLLDEELLKSQQAVYSVPGVDEEEPVVPNKARAKRKRKDQEYDPSAPSGSIKRGKNAAPASATTTSGKDQQPSKSKNTAVYVTNLPLDTEVDEMVERFGKCGLIEEDDEGEPKVKMYAREDGSFSGEALVVFFKEDSVTLAINLMDEAELRLGKPSTRMRVQKAEFSHKNYANGNGPNGEAPRKTVSKKKITKRIGKMQRKLEDWDSEDEFGPSLSQAERDSRSAAANKNNRVVVLKHMFTLQELEEDALLLLDLKEDVRDECASLGEVTNVVLYDKEPKGIMTVKFKDPISAQACIIKMQGRFFAGRKIEASLYSGKERYRRTVGSGDDMEVDGHSDEKKRLDDFANWLLTEGE